MEKLVWLDEVSLSTIKNVPIPNRLAIINFSNVKRHLGTERYYIRMNSKTHSNESDLINNWANIAPKPIYNLFNCDEGSIISFQSTEALRIVVGVANKLGINTDKYKFAVLRKQLSGYATTNKIDNKSFDKRLNSLVDKYKSITGLQEQSVSYYVKETVTNEVKEVVNTDQVESSTKPGEDKPKANPKLVKLINDEKLKQLESAKSNDEFIRSLPKKIVLNTDTNTLHNGESKCICKVDNSKLKDVDISSLVLSDIQFCGRCMRSARNYFLVSEPNAEAELDNELETMRKASDTPIKKHIGDSSIIAKQLEEICNKYKICGIIYGDSIRILTASGTWYFNYVIRPIKIYHLNYETRASSNANREFHRQSTMADSPLDAIVYILSHDKNRISKLLSELDI